MQKVVLEITVVCIAPYNEVFITSAHNEMTEVCVFLTLWNAFNILGDSIFMSLNYRSKRM